MPADPYPGTPATNTLADATKLRAQLDVLFPDVTRRGKCIIATEESRTNTAYGTLTTPDQVTGLVLPTDGLIAVAYAAMWKESVSNAARAAIHLGSNAIGLWQAESAGMGTPETAMDYTGAGVPGTYKPLCSDACLGLAGYTSANGTAVPNPATTGQIIGRSSATSAPPYDVGDPATIYTGGPVYIFAAAGTYTVSIQFKASSGSVTAKNRKLWAWVMTF